MECQRVRDVSKAALNCLYPPSVVILLLIVSYNPVFDAWHWSLWLPLPFVLMGIVLIFNAWSLGHRATVLRTEMVEGIHAGSDELSTEADRERVKWRIDRILSLKGGAFTGFLEMPLVRAVMVPISGAGGISLIQHLTPFLS